MTQLSVLSVNTVASGAPAQAAAEAPPAALAQAGNRAEFAARLLAALAELRGGVAAAPAPAEGESDAESELAPGALPESGIEQPVEEANESDPGLDASAAAPGDVPADFVPLILAQLSTQTPRSETADEDDAGGDTAPEPTPLRFASFEPAEAAAQRSEETQAEEPEEQAAVDESAAALDAPQTAREPAERAREATRPDARVAAAEPSADPSLVRGSEVAGPAPHGPRSEAAAAAPGRVLPELPARNEQEIVDQVRFLLNRKGGQARIELHPPQLGQLGLRISVTDHAVRLEITADRAQVADLLSRHLPSLQHALEAQGLQIDRAQVDLRERASDGRERGADGGDAGERRGRGGDSDTHEREPGYLRRSLPAYSLGAVDVHA